MATAAGGTVTVRRGPREQAYRLPVRGSPALIEWLAQHQRQQFAEEVHCRFAGGRVVGPGVILSPDGRTIARDVSISFGEPPDQHWMLRERGIPRPRRLPGDVASVATLSGQTYYHWLLEELPRFQAAVARGHDTIIAHRAMLGTVPALLGFRERIIDAGEQHHWQCDSLTVESLHGITGNPSPDQVDAIRAIAARTPRVDVAHGERLFISRARASIRRLANEDLLWPALEARGFRRLALESLPWHHQIAAFARAKVVVAPHGAGLANLVFCNPQTRVVEVMHPGFCHWVFWRLASLCDLDYRPVLGAGDGPLRHDFNHNRSDITVAWEAIAAALDD